MNSHITGLHHVTALSSDPQKNLDFYAGILSLRLVKKTINFDAPNVYHLYYGDEKGQPGTIMTFFPISGITPGQKGKGQLTTTSFSIDENSLDYWMARLKKFNIPFTTPQERFDNEVFIYFQDHDGLGLELVANKTDTRKGFTYGQLPIEHAVKGFYGVTLLEDGYEKTGGLLTTNLNHNLVAEKGNRFRYSASSDPGNFVDVQCDPNGVIGKGGSGTVHHVAFATADDASQLAVRENLLAASVNVSPVMDRQYFHSIYFKELGGVLFEVATSDIGFDYDEPVDRLGESLKLPPWQEHHRKDIEQGLHVIQLNTDKFMD